MQTRGDHRIRHPRYVEGCFGCKARTIRLANWTRSARGEKELLHGLMNEAEINRYHELRAEGIQPRGTRWPDLTEAESKSRYRGEPFDAAVVDATKDWGDGAGDLQSAEVPA